MSTVTDIRQGIADKLAAVFGVATAGEPVWEISPVIVSAPPVPCMVVMKGPTEYGEAMGYGTLSALTMLVVAYVGLGATTESQELLDELLDPRGERSVYQALMAPDKNSQVTLDGACGDLLVVRDSGHRLYSVGGVDYLGADWELQVYA